jgi:hypothetical protein
MDVKTIIYTLDSFIESPQLQAIVINCYLVAVGYRPLYLPSPTFDSDITDGVILDVVKPFTTLSVTRLGDNYLLVHNKLYAPNYSSHKELGALLNYPDPFDISKNTSEKIHVATWGHYKNVRIPINQYLVTSNTQVSQITNRLLEMRLLLKAVNVQITIEVAPS